MRYFVYCRKSSEAEDRQILSIDSQKEELRRAFEKVAEIEIVGAFEEAFSAKAPGRKVFDEMLRRIEKGEAEGIIAWHPDRLARNSMDGGRIIYLLDQKVLKALKFATFTFENNSQGKFMLSITFGYSKYYVDSLSENVKRGNRAKIERGWRPNHAPVGYLNDKATKTILRDPDHFAIVRHIFDLVLSETYTVPQIVTVARDSWGYRTPRRGRSGGQPLARSTAYWLLGNPFYAGLIAWNGQLHPGKHEAVVTVTEFDRVQQILHRQSRVEHQAQVFTYRGLITCGNCGASITAERKINRFGSRYIYYHCTHRKRDRTCLERSIEVRDLEAQMDAFLSSVIVPDRILAWTIQQIILRTGSREEASRRTRESLRRSIALEKRKLDTLTDLRLRDALSDNEYILKRQEIQIGVHKLEEKLARSNDDANRIEPEMLWISLRTRAIDWFRSGDNETKRLIVRLVGSNPTLSDRKLSIEAAKPFRSVSRTLKRPKLLAWLDEVRTFGLDTASIATIKYLHQKHGEVWWKPVMDAATSLPDGVPNWLSSLVRAELRKLKSNELPSGALHPFQSPGQTPQDRAA